MLTMVLLLPITIPVILHVLFVDACDGPTYQRHKREVGGMTWSYEESQDWGRLDPSYELCQTGMTQSPIALNLDQGLSMEHVPTFDYLNRAHNGTYRNWGYGPSFVLANEHCIAGSAAMDCPVDRDAPSFTFEDNGRNETVYLVGWHVHAPADHSVQSDRSKAELHLVHVDESGNERAVLAIRVDPGAHSYSKFFSQAPFRSSQGQSAVFDPSVTDFPNYNHTDTEIEGSSDPSLALSEVNNFDEMFTYRGSLTSPPCTEGIRFFLARSIMFVSNEQMQDILRVSLFSARVEQENWLHQVNA